MMVGMVGNITLVMLYYITWVMFNITGVPMLAGIAHSTQYSGTKW